MKLTYVPPKPFRKVFRSSIWESKTDKILISIDDSPSGINTFKILDELKRRSLKAIFFCVGKNMELFPEAVSRILAEGHTIGNHSYSHESLLFMSRKKALSEIRNFNNLLYKTNGISTLYFRPPYGRFNLSTPKALAEESMKMVMWTLLTADYKNDINIVKFAIQRYLKSNSIIVFHDQKSEDSNILTALDYLIETTAKRGFEIGTPAECLN